MQEVNGDVWYVFPFQHLEDLTELRDPETDVILRPKYISSQGLFLIRGVNCNSGGESDVYFEMDNRSPNTIAYEAAVEQDFLPEYFEGLKKEERRRKRGRYGFNLPNPEVTDTENSSNTDNSVPNSPFAPPTSESSVPSSPYDD